MTWQSVVYGGMKPRDEHEPASKNVQSSPEATGRAVSDFTAPVGEYDVKRCIAKIKQLRGNGYSWQRIAMIGAVPKGTAWNYGNGKATPDAGFVERILSHGGQAYQFVAACPDCGSVHNGGRCHGQPVTVRLVRQRQPPPAWVREVTANLARLEAPRGKE